MITKRTKVQLLIFAIITLLGVSYVGARYAKLDRMVLNESYTVTAHYGDSSGGIFTGAEVTYRGVSIGKVSDMVLTRDGVDVKLDIDNKWNKIPADRLVAVVGNRSAVGEQYVELQPATDNGPFLTDGSQIDRTQVPIATQTLLSDIVTTVGSVHRKSLSTTIHELGRAFDGTGPDLQRIIDTSTSFIKTANDNFSVTRALIRDSNTVLNTQVASDSALRAFARGLSAFSTTLAGDDPSLRKVIDNGSFAASQLRTFLEQNQVHLASILNNVVVTGRIVVQNLAGLKLALVVYPYAVGAGYVVVGKSVGVNKQDAHFGLVLANEKPLGGYTLCRTGYETTRHRSPSNGANWAMDTQAHCSEPITSGNVRGEQNLRRIAPDYSHLNSRTIASFDQRTGKLTWGAPTAGSSDSGSVAPRSLGRDSWTWLYLQPLLARQ
ncbi:MAG TPA: MlaD family protein [Nocardioides sp.]|nr:MlaD family protein [Nocardioides sp.]